MNKIDLVPPEERDVVARGERGLPTVAISAQDGATTFPLLAIVEEQLWREGRLERPMVEAPAP